MGESLLYLDDIITFSKDNPKHLECLEEVLKRLKNANLTLKSSKCHFFKKQVEFLGHIISEEGVKTDPMKIKAVQEWPIPRRVKDDVRSFLGLTGYYRRFIKDYGSIAKPLHELTERTTPFVWSEERERAFQQLKDALTSAPILGYPSAEDGDECILDTDASNCHIGAVLSQWQGGTEKVIAYGSKVLSKQERNYCHSSRVTGSCAFCSPIQTLPTGKKIQAEDGSYGASYGCSISNCQKDRLLHGWNN